MLKITVGQKDEAQTKVRRLKKKRADLKTKVAVTDQPNWGTLTQAQKVDALRDIVREMADRVDDLIACEIHELRDLLD